MGHKLRKVRVRVYSPACPLPSSVLAEEDSNSALEKGWRGFSFSFSRLTFALMSPIISQRALTTALYSNRMCASCVDSSAHLHYFCGSPFRRLPSACHAFLFFHDLPARRPIPSFVLIPLSFSPSFWRRNTHFSIFFIPGTPANEIIFSLCV